MNEFLLGLIGMWEGILIMAVLLVMFGAKKLPELARGMGQGIKEFKKATKDVTDEVHQAWNDDDHNQPPPRKLPPANTETARTSSVEEAKPATTTPVTPSPERKD